MHESYTVSLSSCRPAGWVLAGPYSGSDRHGPAGPASHRHSESESRTGSSGRRRLRLPAEPSGKLSLGLGAAVAPFRVPTLVGLSRAAQCRPAGFNGAGRPHSVKVSEAPPSVQHCQPASV
eukprot:756637-Hanusia_phi.AAC.2